MKYHRLNKTIVEEFLKEKPNKGYSYDEIAEATSVARATIQNIIRVLRHRGLVDRFIQRERRRVFNNALKVQEIAYFAWRPEPAKRQRQNEGTGENEVKASPSLQA